MMVLLVVSSKLMNQWDTSNKMPLDRHTHKTRVRPNWLTKL